jgi:GDP-L-fucose synthase
LINVGSGEELTIRKLAETIAEVVDYKGEFVQDTSKPDGTMRKVLDVSRMQGLGWQHKMPLKEGIASAYWDMLNMMQDDAI